VDRQLSREYFTSDAIDNGSAGMTLYYYMCRSWQNCCRRGENRYWPSVSVESVDSECWFLNNTIFYAFIIQLAVEECLFILESYIKMMSYAHCGQRSFEKFRILKMNITHAIEVSARTLRKVARDMVKHVDKCIELNGHHFQHLL
jgi:hypothetical protein